jgi:Methyltransferase domain
VEAEQELQPEREIVEVWERHPDEMYRRDISHWRGEGRWTEERWLALGNATKRRLNGLFRAVRRRMADAASRVVLEWGPGGGANVFALADWASLIYGVDISRANLDECVRIDRVSRAGVFCPILLSTAEPAAATAQLDRPVDVFLSTAVFQHFPSKDYGRQVLDAVRGAMAPDGLGYVQIRYDDGTPRYRSKQLSEYRRSHITATSYGLAEFWSLLVDTGFAPIKIADLNTRFNYASFYFAAAGPRRRPR